MITPDLSSTSRVDQFAVLSSRRSMEQSKPAVLGNQWLKRTETETDLRAQSSACKGSQGRSSRGTPPGSGARPSAWMCSAKPEGTDVSRRLQTSPWPSFLPVLPPSFCLRTPIRCSRLFFRSLVNVVLLVYSLHSNPKRCSLCPWAPNICTRTCPKHEDRQRA